ncbi:hypothetical protein FJZ36_06660 [Candidatus Poribacteria bacterium]|nr:hypothetical protein [Candidatus Poribacteria bacterium]
MTFLVTHVHTHATCPAVNKEVAGTFGRLMQAAHQKACGVEVVGCWIDAPAHTAHMVLSAQSVADVQKFLWPVLRIGSATTTPVVTAAEAMAIAESAD